MKTITKIPCGITIKFDNTMFLKILDKYGAFGWNSWIDAISKKNLIYPIWNKKENPPSIQIEFDLTGVDLSNRDLDGIDLQLVDTFQVIFCHSSLYGAKILIANGCNFIGCDLRTSIFEGCDVSGADFTDAMLDAINWHRRRVFRTMTPL